METKNMFTKDKNSKKTMQTHHDLSPILPLKLTTSKPKPQNYPKDILTVGGEFRKARIDKELTQHEVAKQLNVNKNFVYELELGKRQLTIFALHKAYCFLGHIPKTLEIDRNSFQGKLFIYRIKNNLTYSKLTKQIDLDKSTLSNFENYKNVKTDTYFTIEKYFKNHNL